MDVEAYATARTVRQRRSLVKAYKPFNPRPDFPTGWNILPLAEADFLKHCALAGVFVRWVDIEREGFYIRCNGKPRIYLKRTMRGSHRIHVAMHELGHHLLHVPGEQYLPGRGDGVEVEAEAFAVCATMPRVMLELFSLKEIAERQHVAMSLVEYRAEICERWGF